MRRTKAGVVAAMMAGFFGEPVAAQLATDMRLEDAGFVMRRASKPEHHDSLQKLPPRKFAAHGKGKDRYYLYADPDYCKCVFVGDEKAMQTFRDMRPGVPRPDNSSGAPDTSRGDMMVHELERDAFDIRPHEIFRAPF
ncbi:MAG: hypothetical protein AB7O50_03510 [Pseudolabrys sp.]